MELSWIQRYALLVLLRQNSARVNDMKPPDIAANLFSYHLDGLVAKKLIEKTARGTYHLTTRGQKFAGKFSTATNAVSEEIKTVVILVGEKSGKQLLFRWSRQPYLGQVTPLYDRVPLGKNLSEGITSALHDKLGQDAPTTFLTSALIKIMHEDEIISHMNAVVYRVDLTGIELPFASRNGEAFLQEIDGRDCMSGVVEFLQRIERGTSPFDSEWRY